MFCSVLQCVAVCCSVLQCDTVCCIVLHCVAGCPSALQGVAVCCSVLPRVAVCVTVAAGANSIRLALLEQCPKKHQNMCVGCLKKGFSSRVHINTSHISGYNVYICIYVYMYTMIYNTLYGYIYNEITHSYICTCTPTPTAEDAHRGVCATHCNSLQHTATHYTLHHTATQQRIRNMAH